MYPVANPAAFDKHQAWLERYRKKFAAKLEWQKTVPKGYVQAKNTPAPKAKHCAPKSSGSSVQPGSVTAAKQAAIKNYVHKSKNVPVDARVRAKDKLHTQLRKFDRHKKEDLQYQSAMDWVIAQRGMLFDILMFAVSCMQNRSLRGNVPFALSLLSHYVPEQQLADAQSYVQSIVLNMTLSMQSEDSYEPADAATDPALNSWYDKFRESETWQNLKKLYVYTACLILHGPKKCKSKDIDRFMKECSLSIFENTGNVIYNIIRITKSLFTNFFQCVRTGRWSEFFHSESTYDKWYNDNLDVEREFLANIIPNEAHDLITRTELLLKQGKEMIAQLRELRGARKQLLAVNARYQRTYDLFTKFMGVISATELRRAPFCMQISGHSKIGKTSLLELNHVMFASLFDKDPDVRPFIRQSADRFWDAHKPNQWGIIFDDVCAHNPSVVVGVDDFHKDVIHILNNVPKMAECAALEDKGTHPILVDLAQVTTNVPDLHAGIYFYDTAALFRRLQYRVSLVLKNDFKGTDGYLDPSKIPEGEEFPDLWMISIERATTKRVGDGTDREMGRWEPMHGFMNLDIWGYMKWFKDATSAHVRDQNKFLGNMKKLRQTVMCPACRLPLANHPETECSTLIEQSDQGWEEASQEAMPGYPSDVETGSEEDFVIMEGGLMEQTGDDIEPDTMEPRMSWGEWCKDWFSVLWNRARRPVAHTIIFCADYTARSQMRNAQSNVFHALWCIMKIVWGQWLGQMSMYGLTQLWWPIGLIWTMVSIFLISPSYWAAQLGWRIAPQISILTGFVEIWAVNTIYDPGRVVRLAGRMVFNHFGGNSELLTYITILVAGAAAIYLLLKSLVDKTSSKENSRIIEQGQVITDLKHGVEPENVWRMHDYRCNIIDVPNPSSSLKGADEMTIVSYFHRFLIRLRIKWNVPEKGKWRTTGGTGILLGGNKILFLTHFMRKPVGAISLHEVAVLYSTRANVVREAVCACDKYSVMKFDEELSILDFPAMPAQRAIQTTIPGDEMLNYVGPGLRIGRGMKGELFVDRVKRIHNVRMIKGNHWHTGEGEDAVTIKGDCGALLLALTPSGPVLVGLHLWMDVFDQANKVTYSYNLCGKKFDEIISDAPPQLTNLQKVGELGPLHAKSPIQFLDDLGGMQVFGSFNGFRTSVKSKVTETIGASFLMEKHGFTHTHGPPVMAGREVKYRHLQSFRRSNARVSEYRAELACAVLLQHAMQFSDNWKVFQITQHDAVNGVPGVRFIDRIPMATSCGFPYKTPKFNKIKPIVDGDWTSELIVDDDVQADIDFVLKRWSERKRACPVFTAALKDEPRKFSKIETKSTRIFYGGPAGLIIAERMVFTWFTRLVQTNPLVFMQAPGMDATGSQWDLLFRWMNRSDNWIAGDFKEFDISMIIQFLRMSYKFIILLAKHLGADAEHVVMMEAASEDLINPMVDYFGDLIMGTGKNPSGHALTVIINGLVNAFYMIHCYLELNPAVNPDNRWATLKIGQDFFKDVRAMFYGDDNIMNVSPNAPWFNHTAISQYLRSVNVVYTMAEKDRESVPYVRSDEITFLKRSFRYEPEVDGYVAPLDITSVRKALMLTIPSKVASKEKAYIDCIVSQNDTMWHHGREEFGRFQIILEELIEHLNLREFMERPLLTFDELSARWLRTRDSLENVAWTADTTRYLMQSENSVEIRDRCKLCGGDCAWYCDTFNISQFCDCGNRRDFRLTYDRERNRLTWHYICCECFYTVRDTSTPSEQVLRWLGLV